MRKLTVSVALVVLAMGAAAQDRDAAATLTVGTAVAKRGETSYGELLVPRGIDPALTMPVTVLHGARPGQVVAFVAGSHGTEYASIVALTRLTERLDPRKLAGSVIVAPLLNVSSFEQMTVHVNPIDRKGMNAEYPGKKDGTQTERALALVAEQIVAAADVVVDLHGGDLDEDLRPYSYWTRTGNAAQDDASRSLALAFGLEHIIVRDLDVTNPATTRSLSSYSLARGKTAIVAEAGRSGTVLAEDVDALVMGSLNALGALGLIERSVKPVARPVWLNAGNRVQAEKPGMFFATVGRGASVREGAVIGYTTDYSGRRTGDVRSPATGMVTFIRGVPSMWPGATLVNVSAILSTPPPYAKPSR